MHPTHQPVAVTGDVELTPADVLRHAACYLQRHGWHQGTYYADRNRITPPADTVGAIAMAVYGTAHDEPYHHHDGYRLFLDTVDHLADHLAYAVASGSVLDDDDLFRWNDEPTRTIEQVLALLHDAATAWDHAHQAATTGGAR